MINGKIIASVISTSLLLTSTMPMQGVIATAPEIIETDISEAISTTVATTTTTTSTTTTTETAPTSLPLSDIELIALVTMAEAEGEPEYGKRLVIDTILNRVDSGYFPNTVREVLYQRNQFTCMTNGRVNRCYVRDDIVKLVEEELQSRTNYDVMFFTAGRYGRYGTPMFHVGNHYFCSYN